MLVDAADRTYRADGVMLQADWLDRALSRHRCLPDPWAQDNENVGDEDDLVDDVDDEEDDDDFEDDDFDDMDDDDLEDSDDFDEEEEEADNEKV